MNWIVPALLVSLLVVAALVALWRRRSSSPRRVSDPIDVERLKATLESVGVSVGATDIPDPALLAPYISLQDDFLDAVTAKRGGKRAVLVLLGDRVVAAESTVGRAGAEVHVLPLLELKDFQQGFEIGGHLVFGGDDSELKFTHVPRSQTREFADALRTRLIR